MSSWTTNETNALERCGHCDNCTRAAGDVDCRDVRVQVWQILRIAESAGRTGGRLTLTMLAGLARGAGGGSYDVQKGKGGRKGKGKETEKVSLDLDDICGGKVDLKKEVRVHRTARILSTDVIYLFAGY